VYDLWIVTGHGFVNFPGIRSFSQNVFCKYIDADTTRYRKHRQILSIKQALPCHSVKIRENPNARKKKCATPIEHFRPASRETRDRCATILRRDSKFSRIRWCRHSATRARKMDPGSVMVLRPSHVCPTTPGQCYQRHCADFSGDITELGPVMSIQFT